MTLYMLSGCADLCLWNSSSDDAVGQLEFSTASASQQPMVLKPRRSPVDCKTVFIRDLADPRVSLNGPIPVTVENLGDQVTVYSWDTGDFGVGQDEQTAIDQFRASVVDLYYVLKDEQQALGPLPQQQWDFLRTVIDERN